MSLVSLQANGVSHEFAFKDQEFIKEDSSDSIKLFESWRGNNPDYRFHDWDSMGYTLPISAAFEGNVHFTKHLVQILDKTTLSIQSLNGNQSVFKVVPLDASRLKASSVNRVIKCITLLINAGLDVDAPDMSGNTALDSLLDRAHMLVVNVIEDTKPEENERQLKFIKPFIELYVGAKATCRDTKVHVRTKNPFLLEAQKNVMDFAKIRLLFLAQSSAQSPFYAIHNDVIQAIMHKILDA